jgi:hypothetical protein
MNHAAGAGVGVPPVTGSDEQQQLQLQQLRRRQRRHQDSSATTPSSDAGLAAEDDDAAAAAVGDELLDAVRRIVVSRTGTFLIREARAVSLWFCASIMFRVVVGLLSALAVYHEDPVSVRHGLGLRIPPLVNATTTMGADLLTVLSLAAAWTVHTLLPSKVPSGRCPGFIFANPG